MANDLDFNVQLRLLTEQFNRGVDQARDQFGQLRQSIERNVEQMVTDTERASANIAGLANVSPDKLTAELQRTANELKQMGAGANLSREQIEQAMTLSAQNTARLSDALNLARQRAESLAQTPATPEQLEQAAAKVNGLSGALEAAKQRALDLARTNGTPAEIEAAKAKVDNLGASLDEAKNKVTEMSRTRGTPEDIDAAKAKVDNLGSSLAEARAKVAALSQTNGTPAQIEEAKAKVTNLTGAVDDARLKVEQLSRTNGTPQDITQAKDRVDSVAESLEAARLKVKELSQTNGTPDQIVEAKGKVDSLGASIDEAKTKVAELSRTAGTPEDIVEAKNKVNNLGLSVDEAKQKVRELSQTKGTPEDIEAAKAKAASFKDEIEAAKLKVRELSQTKGTPEDIEFAKAKIISLKDELAAAKSAVKLLSETNASPQDIENAQNKVKALSEYIKGTQDEVKRLRETKGTPEDIANAKAEISTLTESFKTARGEVVKLSQTRGTPEDIATAKTAVNNLELSVTQAKEEVKRLSQTSGTPQDILEAKNKVNALNQSLVDAKAEAKQLSQTAATPAELDAAKAKVNELKGTLTAARDEVKQLSQTSASPADIAEARARLASLTQDLQGARTEARSLSQTSGSPADILEAKARVNELKASLAAARDEVKSLQQTNASPQDIAEAKARVAALKAELGEARTETNRLSQTRATPEDIAAAQAEAQRLEQRLNEARQAAERLNTTGASPQDVAEAAERVRRLEQELANAQRAGSNLSDELANAMNRASRTADDARNAIYRMANVRVPETIRAEIDEISRALVNFQNNSGRPAAEIERVTRAAQEQINRLRQELRGTEEQTERTEKATDRLSGGVSKLRSAFGSLQGMLAAAGLGIGIHEIIEAADAFESLKARIKIATGEGVAFTSAFEGVKQIANATFSSVESTGELFARISQSSQALGMSQKELLSVTETVNQAMKLSGGSAASVDAAITQLIQGLQSGVVRGEEFNSIMEQAPRLAQAMADGLNVTRGGLRAMAMDGKLTSEVVINALRSQKEVIEGEFATLPTTVGNSLQLLKNTLFLFVGDVNESVNQMGKMASAIDYIADGIKNIDPATMAAIQTGFDLILDVIKELFIAVKDAYTAFSDITQVMGGAVEEGQKVGLITRIIQQVSLAVGILADGFKGLSIVVDSVFGSISGIIGNVLIGIAKLTGGTSEMGEELIRQQEKLHARSEQKMMEFQSSAGKAWGEMSKTQQDRNQEAADHAIKKYEEMEKAGTYTAEALQEQFIKTATAKIKANDMVVSDELRLQLAAKDLQATVSETGEITIESAKGIQAAYEGVGESFAEVAFEALQTGTSVKESLIEALPKAQARAAVDDIITSLGVLSSQGKISGAELAEGMNLANERYREVEAQIDRNKIAMMDFAAKSIAANNGVISAELQHTAAVQGLAVQMDETGAIMVTELDETTKASGRSKEQIDELADSVGVGLSKEFRKAQAAVDEVDGAFKDLEDSGYDARGALVGTLTEMTEKAKNRRELEIVIERWQELGKEGKITGQELADGLDTSKLKLAELEQGVSGVEKAFKLLGLVSRTEAAKQSAALTEAYDVVKKSGEATTRQLDEAWQKTAKAAITANGDVISSTIKNQAAQRGLTVAVDETGRVTFEKMGQAAKATTEAKPPVDNLAAAHNNLGNSAGRAGNAMVNAAQAAMSAYDKLQQKIKQVKEAQELKNADETLKNLRIYGTEKAPVEGNQFGSRLAVEGFLKSSGLSEARAIEEARKLYAKAGKSDGALDFGKLQGYQDGQVMTQADLQNYKSASVYLAEIAQKARDDEARRSKYESGLNKYEVQTQAMASQYKTPSYDTSSAVPTKKIEVNFKLGNASASMSMPENQEASLMALLQQLKDSKAIAGY